MSRAFSQSNIWNLCLLKGKDEILNKVSQHFNQLLNVPGSVNKTAVEGLPYVPADKGLDNVPNCDKLNVAIAPTADNTAPGDCWSPA